MSIFSQLLAFFCAIMFIAAVLYVLFGQVTVRKLRKNPATKTALGIEFVSGWDIINVAQALAFPRSWSRKLEDTPLAPLYGKSDLLFAHTSRFDQILGSIFYWLLMFSGLGGAVLVLLNALGLFKS